MPRPRPAVLALAAAVVLGGASVWLIVRGPARPQIERSSCRGCNFLLITVDTLRSDHVGAFGGPPNLTPTIDRLAAEGIRMTGAYASAPLTLPSHASILTGTPPPVHGIRANGLFRLGPSLPTLATILKAAGYRTGAFVGAFVLDARFGLNRGFDVYDDRYGEKPANDVTEGAERRAEDVINPAAAWILHASLGADRASGPRADGPPGADTKSAPAAAAQPWFAWVHLYDPHEPYDPPPGYAAGRDPYDGEIAYADAMIGRLLDRLRTAGQLDRTLVTVAADHGESLGEHGERTHGVFVYDATMKVPWVIWAGAHIGSGAFDGLSRLIDLAPTSLDLLGVPLASSFVGTSLVGVIRGAEPPPATAYLEAMDANLTRNWAPLTAVIGGGDKFIELPIPELYHLAADPAETANLFSREPTVARTMASLLHEVASQLASRATGEAGRPVLSTESRQRLQALGYVASSADPARRTYTDADDPKNLIAVANALNAALAEFKAGSRDRAMSEAAAIIRAHPTFTTAYGILARMQRDEGDLPGAIRTLETAVSRGGTDPSVMTVLAGYLQQAGAMERAAGVLQAVLESHPDYADAWNALGVTDSRMGRHAEARRAFAKVLELDPTSATAYENLGSDAFHGGDLDAAAAALERAIALDPKLAVAHTTLGAVRLRRGDPDRAFAEWKTALQLDPQLYDALYNLGVSLWDAGRRDEAAPYLERFVREAPPRYERDVARLRAVLEARK